MVLCISVLKVHIAANAACPFNTRNGKKIKPRKLGWKEWKVITHVNENAYNITIYTNYVCLFADDSIVTCICFACKNKGVQAGREVFNLIFDRKLLYDEFGFCTSASSYIKPCDALSWYFCAGIYRLASFK